MLLPLRVRLWRALLCRFCRQIRKVGVVVVLRIELGRSVCHLMCGSSRQLMTWASANCRCRGWLWCLLYSRVSRDSSRSLHCNILGFLGCRSKILRLLNWCTISSCSNLPFFLWSQGLLLRWSWWFGRACNSLASFCSHNRSHFFVRHKQAFQVQRILLLTSKFSRRTANSWRMRLGCLIELLMIWVAYHQLIWFQFLLKRFCRRIRCMLLIKGKLLHFNIHFLDFFSQGRYWFWKPWRPLVIRRSFKLVLFIEIFDRNICYMRQIWV